MVDFESARRWTPDQPADAKRDHCVSVRMNTHELAALDIRRGEFARGEYLRRAFLDALPAHIPELNRDAWLELSRAASNLNQLSKALNESGDLDLDVLRQQLAQFRAALLGAST